MKCNINFAIYVNIIRCVNSLPQFSSDLNAAGSIKIILRTAQEYKSSIREASEHNSGSIRISFRTDTEERRKQHQTKIPRGSIRIETQDRTQFLHTDNTIRRNFPPFLKTFWREWVESRIVYEKKKGFSHVRKCSNLLVVFPVVTKRKLLIILCTRNT